MWYAYANDRNNLMAIPIEKVKELAEGNRKGKLPEKLEDFAFMKEQQANDDYGNGNNDPQYYNYE